MAQLLIDLDRESMARHGLTPAAMARAVEALFQGVVVGEIVEDGIPSRVVVRFPERLRSSPEDLAALPVTTPQGRILRLDEVATIRSDLGPGIIRRENVGRLAMLTANVAGSDLAGTVEAARDAVAAASLASCSVSGQLHPPEVGIPALGSKRDLLSRAETTTLGGDYSAEQQEMRSKDFFEEYPVFTHREFVAAHAGGGRRSERTSNNLLAKHLAAGHILRIRRGLYAAVPRRVNPEDAAVDPYLLATKLTDDATVAFHAALQFHGRSYSIWHRFDYLTRDRYRPFSFRGMEFVPVQAPAPLRALRDLGGGILEERHAGGVVRVTTLERALVDVLSAPRHGGGWEEIWRSLQMVEFFDLDTVIRYALMGSAVTVARVGFFLEQHREQLMVEEHHLAELRPHVPSQPRYLDGQRESGKLLTGWNLVVPERVLERSWEELG